MRSCIVVGVCMASRNFGLGSRDMVKAGLIALDKRQDAKGISYGTEERYKVDWKAFCAWAREQGIKKMEGVGRDDVIRYGKEIAQRVQAEELKPATAQMKVSVVNCVLKIASGGQWRSVSPTKECDIQERVRYREDTPAALERQTYDERLEAVKSAGYSDRAIAICELARELGLRSKEASLLDAKAALKQAQATGRITVDTGNKGGASRTLSVSASQVEVLARAAQAQGNARAVMPPDHNWKTWQQAELRRVREAMGGLRELRTSYACERYEQEAGHAAPCTGQSIGDKALDREVRLQIAKELGHGRIDVVAEYVGRRG